MRIRTNTYSIYGIQTKRTFNDVMQYSQLLKLFEDELKGIYWAEKVIAKTLIRLIKNATSAQLIDTLKINLEETIIHVIRLEDVFKSLDKTPVTKKCESLEVLIKETGEIIDSCEEGAMCDAAIISATQRLSTMKLLFIEHCAGLQKHWI
ncbi:MAG: DUF892 family protein [Bacteroidetes bacterium]|nr:DUF892 family protein [Bacteroidota bacterium]